MPNDDLGQFPTPTDPIAPTPPANPIADSAEPVPAKPDISSLLEDINSAPLIPNTNNLPTENSEPKSDTNSTFEETPDVIPSVATIQPPQFDTAVEDITPLQPIYSAPAVSTAPPVVVEPAPVAAVSTPKGGSAFGSLIVLVLLLISGVALAVTVFLFSQSQQLKQQLSEVTQTLDQQRTTVTPTPTPTIIEFPTPTPTPEATESATITPTPTSVATISAETVLPLADASKILKVGINHLPNAQMILVKTENATSPTLATTKYFFRQDLTTKKYFYVLVAGGKEPEIVDKAIYVTPDNNIPSLNDLIQGNTTGIDLDQAVTIAKLACTNKAACEESTIKAQYIKSGTTVIWQLSITPADSTKGTLVTQINANTKEILFKSAGY